MINTDKEALERYMSTLGHKPYSEVTMKLIELIDDMHDISSDRGHSTKRAHLLNPSLSDISVRNAIVPQRQGMLI